jgi:putative ABC transport system ATP-binding protein
MNDITYLRRVESEPPARETPGSPRAVVELSGITRRYRLGQTGVTALAGVDLRIERGDFAALAGPSGSGKTTLLNIIGCIDKPDAGRIVVDGDDVTAQPLHRLAALRNRQFGYVFQTFNLLPVLNAYENVELPLLLAGTPLRERRERVETMLARVGLAAHRRQRPNELSGGQRQRVAIARALVVAPAAVLADEPTANLDSRTAAEIVALMGELNETERTTFIFSTHDPSIIRRARRVLRMVDGRVEEEGLRRLRASGE